jgi:hypothetical protein
MRAKGYMTALNSSSSATGDSDTGSSMAMAALAPIQAPTSSYAFYAPNSSNEVPAGDVSSDLPFDPVLLATLGSLSLYPKE